MRPFVLALLALAALVLVAAAGPRGCQWRVDPNDAEKGAGIGGALAGPQGAAIGAVVALVVGAITRAIEKPRLERRHADEREQLTRYYSDKLAQLAETARTVRRDDALTRNTPQQEPPP